MPVQNARQLSEQIEKIIQYEADEGQGGWKRRINFIAGTGGVWRVE